MSGEGREGGGGKGWAWCGGLFLLFFLLFYFPAARAYPLLVQYVPALGGAVSLSGLEGTWLSGSAREGLIGGIPVRQVRWAAKPWGQAALEFRSGEEGHVAGRLALGRGGRLRVTELQARLPLALLQELLGSTGLQMDGLAAASLTKLEFADGRLQAAEGTLVCSRLRVVQPLSLSLGDFKMELTTAAGEIKAVVTDSGGPLAVHGVFLLRNDGNYSFSGSVLSRGDELAPIVRLLGNPAPDGSVAITRSGTLPPLFS